MSLSSKKCCVPGCMDSGNMQLPLHLFPNPVKDKQRFDTWLLSIGGDIIGMNNDDVYKLRRVCHAHFEEKFCCRYNRLSNIALPTLKLTGLLSTPQITFAERTPLQEMQNLNSETIFPSTSKGLVSTPQITFAERTPLQEMQNLNSETIFPSTSKDVETDLQTSSSAGVAMTENIDPIIEVADISGTVAESFCKMPEVTITKSALDVPEVVNKITQPALGLNSAKNINKSYTKKALYRKVKTLSALELELYKQLVQTRAKLSKFRSKTKKQSASLKATKKLISNPVFLEAVEKLPNTAKILTLLQFREIKKKDKGHRFTLEEKIVGLSILKQSPKCYRFLRKIFILPAPQTITKLLNQANVKPGINKKIFTQLKKATEELKVEEKLCIVLFDEMSLKANISYNERKDHVTGFVTDGQKIIPEYADHAQVFMIRGLIRNYKQPVSYTFSAAATSGPELAKQLKEVINELQEAGLIVVATVSDQGTNNRNAIKLLIEETRGILLRAGQEPKDNIFMINNQKIVPLYDPPHLIKCIRNNMLTKNLTYFLSDQQQQIKTAKWQHIEMLHQENPGYKGIRLIPKLTDNHVIPKKISKMKVKYATQVFSQTVASNMGYLADKGILPKACQDTADILMFFDKLFDSVNGSYAKKTRFGKPLLGPVKPNSVHHGTWTEAIKLLKSMKFVNISSGKPERVPTLENWVWTLEGIKNILKMLKNKYDITSVWMRHLNQDPIENFFGAIRSHGCRNINPTPEKFESAYTSLLINNLSSVHAPGANCEKDYCTILNNLIITDDCQADVTSDFNSISNVGIIELNEKNDPRVIGPLRYVSGYFVNSTRKKVFKNCKTCYEDMFASVDNDYINRREYAGKHWLVNPSESFLTCMSAVQDINNDVLKKNISCKNIKELIKTMIFCHLPMSFDFLKCNEHKDKIIEHVINLTCRFYIYNYCKDINKILKGRRDPYDDEDTFQMKAKKYFHKCYKRHNK